MVAHVMLLVTAAVAAFGPATGTVEQNVSFPALDGLELQVRTSYDVWVVMYTLSVSIVLFPCVVHCNT
jgi:hypothetical protein